MKAINEVYIKVDNTIVIGIYSDWELKNKSGYIAIDSGYGDKYTHAQNNYLPLDFPLIDSKGRYNYKYENNEIVRLTEQEKETLFPKQEVTAEENLIDKLILDNINMQSQIDSLIQAQLGGN